MDWLRIGSVIILYFGLISFSQADSITVSQLYNTGALCGDGCWQQDGQKYQNDMTDIGYSIEYSHRVIDEDFGLSVSVGFSDLGEINGWGEFISDEDYIKAKAGKLKYPCEKCLDRNYAYKAWYTGTMKLLHVSIDPSYKFNSVIEGYLKVGYAFYDGTFTLKRKWHHAPNEPEEYGSITNVIQYERTDRAPFYGAGFNFKLNDNHSVLLGAYLIPKGRVPESVSMFNYGGSLGYRYSWN